MKLAPVKSSNIQALGYDPEMQILDVQFKSGKQYHYHGVPPDAHQALMQAESLGKHFGTHIRNAFHAIEVKK